MRQSQGGDVWREPITSISPRGVTSGIDSHAHITIVVGDRDDVVPAEIGADYYEQLKTRGVDAELIRVPGVGHDIFFEQAVRDAVRRWLK
ncbi:MAG TPA: alpha/beta hydrolase [Vicinamibacterales bacterium]